MKHTKWLTYFFLFLLLASYPTQAANKPPYLLIKANTYYKNLQFASAAAQYEIYLRGAVNKNDEAILLPLADCYWQIRNYEKARPIYELIRRNSNGNMSDLVQFRLSELAAMEGNYEEAKKLLAPLNAFDQKRKGYDKLSFMKRDSLDFKVDYVNINTRRFREFSPEVIGDRLIWATNQYSDELEGKVFGWDSWEYTHLLQTANRAEVQAVPVPNRYQDLADSSKLRRRRIAESYELADKSILVRNVNLNKIPLGDSDLNVKIGKPIVGITDSKYNVAHMTYSPYSLKAYYTVNDLGKIKVGGTRRLQIMEADFKDGSLSNRHLLALGDTSYSVMHPAIHPKGNILVYSSDQGKVNGDFDLYYIVFENNVWSSPLPLTQINTKGNEVFPRFDYDGVLYFSTDGRQGLGGLDIYKVRLAINGGNNKVEHVTYPINTKNDDFGISFAAGGKSGYFTSDRYGSDDILAFTDLERKILLKGTVFEKPTMKREGKASVCISEEDEDGVYLPLKCITTDSTGDFSVEGKPNRKYRVRAKDYWDDQQITVQTPDNGDLFKIQDILMKRPQSWQDSINAIKKTTVVNVQPPVPVPPIIPVDTVKAKADTVSFIIYFDFDKYQLDLGFKVLAQLRDYLKAHRGYRTELVGHTDLEGGSAYNVELSKRRVEAARNYLLSYGISAKDITTNYRGLTEPAVNTRDKTLSWKNRRVEIRVFK